MVAYNMLRYTGSGNISKWGSRLPSDVPKAGEGGGGWAVPWSSLRGRCVCGAVCVCVGGGGAPLGIPDLDKKSGLLARHVVAATRAWCHTARFDGARRGGGGGGGAGAARTAAVGLPGR